MTRPMISASGSTRRWKNLRAHYAEQLPCECWRCGQMIGPSDRWHLGHLVDRAEGGTELDGVAPEHELCSKRAGGQLSASRALRPVIAGQSVVTRFTTDVKTKNDLRSTRTRLASQPRSVAVFLSQPASVPALARAVFGAESRDRDW